MLIAITQQSQNPSQTGKSDLNNTILIIIKSMNKCIRQVHVEFKYSKNRRAQWDVLVWSFLWQATPE